MIGSGDGVFKVFDVLFTYWALRGLSSFLFLEQPLFFDAKSICAIE